ncbi:MAG: UDP-3-O-[3-hydroxymyristoyl] glucosamine N-acyltransferase, partial [bacterium]
MQFTPTSWGRSDDHRTLGDAPVHTTPTGVVYEHPGIDAWFQTTERGLRHGFEVHHAPSGTGPLQVTLALGTDRNVLQTVDGLRLIGDDDVLTYTGLAAWDADGRPLDSWMDLNCEADECTVALTVDDSWARYPLTIDPEGGPEDNCVGDPNKDDPGYCGCFFFDLDLDDSGLAETCVHIDAEVYGTIGAGSQIFSDVWVHERAQISTDVELGIRTQVHASGTVGANTDVGDDCVVGRRGTIGDDSTVGSDVIVSRLADLGDRTDAMLGDITLGYASQIGDDSLFQGQHVIIGNLVTVGNHLTVGANVVIARSASIGDDVTIGAGTVIGPDVTIGNGTVIGEDVRIRKSTNLGERVTLYDDVRIGRSTVIGDGVDVGANTTVRASVDIGANNSIDADLYIQRGTIMQPITSVPGNDPPIAVADDAQTFVGKPVRILALRNDTDPDGDSLTLVNVQTPDGGQTVIDANAIVYTPGASQTGLVTFTYTVEDSVGQTDSATITVTVVAADVPPEVVITSPSDLTESGNSSHSVTLTGAVSDDNGIVAVTYQLDDAVPVSMGSNAGAFSLPVTIPAVTQILRVIATDTAGQSTTARVTFTNCDNASTFTHSWTGAVDSVWDESGNWSNNVVPATTHNVFICGNTVNKPVLQANTTTAKLWVDPGGQLDTNGYILTTNGNVVARDIIGTGTVRLRGSNPTIWGSVPNLQMYSAAHMYGPLTVTGNGSGHGSLALNGNPLTVDGDWTQSGAATTGGLLMRDPTDRVSIFGNLTFTGGANSQTGGAMTDGELWIYGNVAQTTSSYNTGMQPTGTVFVFAGSSSQNATTTSASSYLGDVRIQNPAGVTMNGSTTMTVKGQLEMVGDGLLISNRLRFTDFLPLTSALYDVAVTQVNGHIALTEDWDGMMDRLEIINGKSLSPNGHVLRLDGDFYQYASNASYGLQMDDMDDYVVVTGNAEFQGGATSAYTGAMNNGELHLQGDFTQTSTGTSPYTFQPTGTTVVFDGTTPQRISFTYPGSNTNYFDDL